MLIKLNNGWFESETIDFDTYKRIFPNATISDFNDFKGVQEIPIIKIENELQKNDIRKGKGTNKKISAK